MKKEFSISYKWALLLGLMIIALLLAGVIINKVFFYDYYLEKEKEDILSFAIALNQVYDDDLNAADLIDRFVLKNQASINILDNDEYYRFSFGMFMNSNYRGRSPKMGASIELPHNIEELLEANGYMFFNFEHNQLSTDLLSLVYALDSGELLMVTMPFEEIGNTADTAIEFNMMVAAVLITLGMIVVFILARRMTKPIIKLSQMTQKISKLDFSETFELKSKDEIGLLGSHINSMSHSLENALSDLKSANQQLVVDLEEKEKLVEMRKSFIANISHELKTPISLVMSYAEGLKDNDTLDSDQTDYYLDVIRKEADYMNILVRDLLNLAELEYDATQLHITDFDLSSLIDEILDRYILMISEKKLQIQLNKNDIVQIKGDKKRLEQAITNLVVNALEHTPTNGTIVIVLKETDFSVNFEIKNSGGHIADENLESIWKTFYKSEDSKHRRIGGTGIGLSIVKAIIDKHYGSCGVKNDESGVIFWFEIPK